MDFEASHYALQSGHREIAELLLEADTTLFVNHTWTPLHVVAQEGHAELVDLALKYTHAGINVFSGEFGTTPLNEAVGYGRAEVARVRTASLLCSSDCRT